TASDNLEPLSLMLWRASSSSIFRYTTLFRSELVVAEALVLGAVVLALERAHQVADAADGVPVVAALDAEDQPGAEGVAAAGGVGDAALLGRRRLDHLAIGVDHRALGAAGGDVGLDLAGDGGLVPAGALLQQVGL